MKWTIRFQQSSPLPSVTLTLVWVFPFTVVDSALVGAPEENRRTTPHQVRVSASIQLVHAWGFIFSTDAGDSERAVNDRYNLMKVMFEYGKRYVLQKLKDMGKLDTEESLNLTMKNTEVPCLFDPSRIQDPMDAICEVNTDSPSQQSSGVNITVNNGDVNIAGNVVGRDNTTNN